MTLIRHCVSQLLHTFSVSLRATRFLVLLVQTSTFLGLLYFEGEGRTEEEATVEFDSVINHPSGRSVNVWRTDDVLSFA